MNRPDWDAYFSTLVGAVSTRSNCVRRQFGAVLVRDRRVLSTGYNGTPRGVKNCMDGGCPRCASSAPSGTGLLDCLCSHAEENAIVQCGYHGVSTMQATLYCSGSPCLNCAKMIVNAGITRVVYQIEYPNFEISKGLFDQVKMETEQQMPGTR